MSEFEDGDFYGFCGDFEQNGQKSELIRKKELEKGEYIKYAWWEY